MNKTKITPQMVRQLRQTGGEVDLTEDEEKKEYKEYEENKESKEEKENQEMIAQLKAQKEAWARRRREEIEAQIRKLVEERRQQMLKRQEKPHEGIQKQKLEEEQKKKTLPEVPTKTKKGLFWGKRIKTAQQQAQPETVGRRIGG